MQLKKTTTQQQHNTSSYIKATIQNQIQEEAERVSYGNEKQKLYGCLTVH